MTATSAQHAALRILLEDVDPLVQRTEEAAQLLAKVREELNADLETLGRLVQQSVDAQPAILEVGRKLTTSAARIETAMQGSASPVSSATAKTSAGRRLASLWSACAISAAITAALVTGMLWFGMRDVMEQARVGRALMSAWPSLDAATRTKVHEFLGRS
jgi:ABC-type transporter Mla subunit MlaD